MDMAAIPRSWLAVNPKGKRKRADPGFPQGTGWLKVTATISVARHVLMHHFY